MLEHMGGERGRGRESSTNTFTGPEWKKLSNLMCVAFRKQ